MVQIDENLVKAARSYVLELLERSLPEKYVYHSVSHTERVYENAILIGKAEDLSSDELNLVKIAALFHDIGYISSKEDHERESAEHAKEFLTRHRVDQAQIEQVEQAIYSTRVPQNPLDKISRVLCDADLAHLAAKDYFEQACLMREEIVNSKQSEFSEQELHHHSLDFFRNHHFHTRYGRDVLQKGKEINEQRIRKRLLEIKSV